MEDNYHVRHIVIESLLDIDPLLCSKYVQSDIADTFNVLADAVKAGKKAMFCGTPCQCAAIRRFLNKKGIDKKLVLDCFIAVEFICHGVPSPEIWEDYIRGLCEEKHVKLLDVGFRRKTDVGWHQFTFTYREGIEIRSIPIRKDIYFNGFLENLFLRDCCYECNFKGIESSADISIADFWGSEKYAPELNEYKHIGISLMTIFSEKGIGIFEEIKNNLYYVEVTDICAFTSNTASVERACRNRDTKAFYKTKTKRGTMVALRRYAANTLSKKVRNKIKWKIGFLCKRN